MTLDIYLISRGGLNLYAYKSGKNLEIEDADDHLLSCIIFGIVKALKCVTKSKVDVERIDLGELRLHFQHGLQGLGFLITDRENTKLNEKLASLIFLFERRYEKILRSWNGDRKKFQGAKKLIEELF